MFDTQEPRGPVTAALPNAQAVQLPAAPPQPVHLLDRLNAVFRHRRLAAVAFALVVTGMMVQTYSTIPVYQAMSRIQIQDERTMQVGMLNANDPAFWQESEPYYRTQHAIIRSREVARRVVRRLDLQGNPLFNGSAPPPRDPISLARQARAAAGTKLRSLFSSQPAPTAPVPAPDESAQEAALINAFLGGVDVQPEPSPRIVRIISRHRDPQFAAVAANTVAEEYAQQNIDLRLANVQSTLKFLDAELKRYELQLKDSESALTKYREDHNAGSLEDKQNLVLSRLTQLNETLTRTRNERLNKQAVYDQLKGADPASDAIDNFPIVGSNSGVVEAKNALSTLNATRSSYVGRYGPEHPKMAEVNTQIDNAKRRLVAERTKVIENVRNDYNALLAQERSFGGQLQDQQAAVNELDKKGGDYKILQRKADSERDVYQKLVQ